MRKCLRHVLIISISFLVLFSCSLTSALEQSPNSTVTIKLKVLSEDMKASDIDEIRSLIDAGADVNVINEHGTTPLCMASSYDHTEIVELLKE